MEKYPPHEPTTQVTRPSGQMIIRAIKNAGIKFVAAVPDIVTSQGLLWPLYKDEQIKLIKVCREDEGVSICAAMSYSNTRALLLMQQTGLMDSVNAIRAIAVDYQLPVCMMVGLQGKEDHLKPAESESFGVRIIEPILDTLTVTHTLVEEPSDTEKITTDINRCYDTSSPHCILIGRSPL